MKKWMTLLLTLLLALSLTACGGNTNSTGSTGSDGGDTKEEAEGLALGEKAATDIVELTLDRGDTTIKKGESVSITATVKLGDKNYDNSNVQWSVNDELEANGGTFTFTPSEAGSYVVRAGIEINGTFSSAQITVTVQADPTTISVTGNATITAGNSTTLTATVQNKQGDVTWSCDETSWKATGDQVTFTANEAGTYHIHAANNGADSVFVLTVSAAATPEPTAVPTPMPEPTPADSTPQ